MTDVTEQDKSYPQRAYEFIKARGVARSRDIAEHLDIFAADVGAMLARLVDEGHLLVCKVEVPGTRAQNEYRIGSGMRAPAFRALRGASKRPPRHPDAPAPAGAPTLGPDGAGAAPQGGAAGLGAARRPAVFDSSPLPAIDFEPEAVPVPPVVPADAQHPINAFEQALRSFEASPPVPPPQRPAPLFDAAHDPDSELALAVAALNTLSLLLASSDSVDGSTGLAELIDPIAARVNAARHALRKQAQGGQHAA